MLFVEISLNSSVERSKWLCSHLILKLLGLVLLPFFPLIPTTNLSLARILITCLPLILVIMCIVSLSSGKTYWAWMWHHLFLCLLSPSFLLFLPLPPFLPFLFFLHTSSSSFISQQQLLMQNILLWRCIEILTYLGVTSLLLLLLSCFSRVRLCVTP